MYKAVVPVAGLGTRMLPITKEQPKEMLPIFDCDNNNIIVKPFVQKVFEELYMAGIRNFCFIVGRGKRSIEDYFSIDDSFIHYVRNFGKKAGIQLEKFYKMISECRIIWINQHRPLGFGHAVLLAEQEVNADDLLLVHAGDTLLLDKEGHEYPLLKNIIKIHEELQPDALVIVKEVSNPKIYGVVILGEKIGNNIYRVNKILEKPCHPPSNIASMAIYTFNNEIFKVLKRVKPSSRGEIELTDGIQLLIENGRDVLAYITPEEYVRIDIGTLENYWEALQTTYNLAAMGKRR